MFESKLMRVLFAGLWFGVAAVVPVVYVFLRFEEASSLFGGSLFMTIVFPILISVVCGSALGSTILDPEEIKNEIQATLRGFTVAALSYLLMFTIPAIIFVFYKAALIDVIVYSLFLFFYGLLLVGWLAGVAGAVAGLTLYLCRLKFPAKVSFLTSVKD